MEAITMNRKKTTSGRGEPRTLSTPSVLALISSLGVFKRPGPPSTVREHALKHLRSYFRPDGVGPRRTSAVTSEELAAFDVLVAPSSEYVKRKAVGQLSAHFEALLASPSKTAPRTRSAVATKGRSGTPVLAKLQALEKRVNDLEKASAVARRKSAVAQPKAATKTVDQSKMDAVFAQYGGS